MGFQDIIISNYDLYGVRRKKRKLKINDGYAKYTWALCCLCITIFSSIGLLTIIFLGSYCIYYKENEAITDTYCGSFQGAIVMISVGSAAIVFNICILIIFITFGK